MVVPEQATALHHHAQPANGMLPSKKSKRANRSPQDDGLVMQDRSNHQQHVFAAPVANQLPFRA